MRRSFFATAIDPILPSVKLPRVKPLVAILASAAPILGCATPGPGPDEALASFWREYETLPDERAIAIAGTPGRGRWVTGASAGHAIPEDAEASAISECRARRAERRMQAECVLYAVGDEIVWRGR